MRNRAICLAATLLVLAAIIARSDAQNSPRPSAPTASFEAATIKPSPPGDGEDGMQGDGHHMTIRRIPLTYLIASAYNIPQEQIIGGPTWVKTAKYDIDAVTSVKSASSAQLASMMQSLLSERFHLKFHREKKERSIYSLSVGKGGDKLAKHPPDEEGANFSGKGMAHLVVSNGDMQGFARWLSSGIMDRPVVDNTNLNGKYDFTLNWTPDDSQYSGMGFRARHSADGSDPLPGIFTAVQEQLGLKLEPAKAQADVIVIDQLDRPTEN